jgi:hypothetical protein
MLRPDSVLSSTKRQSSASTLCELNRANDAIGRLASTPRPVCPIPGQTPWMGFSAPTRPTAQRNRHPSHQAGETLARKVLWPQPLPLARCWGATDRYPRPQAVARIPFDGTTVSVGGHFRHGATFQGHRRQTCGTNVRSRTLQPIHATASPERYRDTPAAVRLLPAAQNRHPARPYRGQVQANTD